VVREPHKLFMLAEENSQAGPSLTP
jgi:hypothetical protein